MSRLAFYEPLRFDVPIWRWSEEKALRECEALTARHLQGRRWKPFEFERFQLWDLAGQALRMRRTYRYEAWMLIQKVRRAWAARDQALALQGYLDEAHHLVEFVKLRPTLEMAERARSQRRDAARAPRNGVRDEEIEAHRALHVARYGTSHGWQKRAAIDLGMSDRALRRRLEKMRA